MLIFRQLLTAFVCRSRVSITNTRHKRHNKCHPTINFEDIRFYLILKNIYYDLTRLSSSESYFNWIFLEKFNASSNLKIHFSFSTLIFHVLLKASRWLVVGLTEQWKWTHNIQHFCNVWKTSKHDDKSCQVEFENVKHWENLI